MTNFDHEREARMRLNESTGRVTPARIGVLSLLLGAKSALAHQEVEQLAQQQGLSFDRVTLYRALDWLVENGVAHRITGVDRSWRYNALVDTTVQQHAHFLCKECNQVFCLENLQPAPLFSLPTGYQMVEIELNLKGYCPDCPQKNAT